MSHAPPGSDSKPISYASNTTVPARQFDRSYRERRANLIFIGIMLALTLPAIIITLVKYARGIEAKRPLVPPATRSQWAYMDTTPVLSGIPRVTPPMTGSFVAEQARRLLALQPGLRSIVAEGDFRAVMSDQLHVQLVALGPDAGKYRLGMIGWNRKLAPIASLFTFTGHRSDGSTVAGEMEAFESVNVPLDVRQELQAYGFIIPPDGIMWMIVAFDGETPVSALDIAFNGNGLQLRDSLSLASELID